MTEPRSSHETLAERKERLMLQCRAYRAAVGHSKKVVREKISTRAIASTAFGLAGLRAQSSLANIVDLFDMKNFSAAKVQRLLPLLASGYSLLARRSLLKPMLRGGAILGVAGAALYFFSQRKSASKKRHDHAVHHEHL